MSQIVNRVLALISLCFVYSFTAVAQVVETDNILGPIVTIESEVLGDERTIQIYLPESYENGKEEYPVLYILDGQRYFLHGVSLAKTFEEFRETPPFIIVGKSKNPSDRNTQYSRNSIAYLQHIKTEVIPYLTNHFRVSSERILFGWAFAGGFTINSLINDPLLFDSYIAASPFPVKDKSSGIDSLFAANSDWDGLLFFTSGKNEGLVWEETSALNELLSSKHSNLNLQFVELTNEEHRSTPFTTLYHGLQKHFEYYPEPQFNSLDEFLESGGLDYVFDYYGKRSERYGFPNKLSDWTMFSITRNAIRAENFHQFDALYTTFEKTGFISRLRVSRACSIAGFYHQNQQYNHAIELFQTIANSHPNSTQPFIGLMAAYKVLGDEEKAKECLKKVQELKKSE